MKRLPIVLLVLLLFLIIGSFYYIKSKKYALLSDTQIVDAVHMPQMNTLFEKADAAKYAQDYKKADSEFRQLLNKNDSIAIFKSELEKLVGANNIHQLNDYATSDRITFLNRQLEKLMLLKLNESNGIQNSLTTLRQKLNPNQAIIQYSLDKEQAVLHALYISRDTVHFYQYASKDLKNQLVYYQTRIKDYNNTNKEKAVFAATSYFLYQKLIQPFEYDLYKRNDLVIIPEMN